jgi:hypothetical protein
LTQKVLNTLHEPKIEPQNLKNRPKTTKNAAKIMQNKPNLLKCRNKRKLSYNKELRKSPAFQPTKQTQFTQRQNNLNLCHRKDLRNQTPLCEIRHTNYAKQTQFAGCSNKHNHSHRKDLQEFPAFRPPQKQTQSNPIPNLLFVSLLPSIRFRPTAFCESGEGNSWYFKLIMVQTMALKRLNYVVERLNAKSWIGGC